MRCGASLAAPCPSCGGNLPADARFCPGCGTAREAAPNGGASRARAEGEAERRQLTVAFLDLVDSTELSQLLDAEDYRELVRAYQHTCAEVVERYEGWIAQYLGDGILVYFGYPQAHEDDSSRALDASLEIQADMPALSAALARRFPSLRGRDVQIRVGVHTGPVVVGDMGQGGQRSELALGDTVNLTFRLLGVARPGDVVTSAATGRLVQGLFLLDDLGPQHLRGIGRAVQAFRVRGPSGVRSRLDHSATTGLTPLVGREQEVALMLDRWEKAKEGAGQAVVLGAEAGMGKSRLVQVLCQRLTDEPHAGLEGRCSPYHQTSAFHPVVGFLEHALRFEAEEPTESRIAKLEEAFDLPGLARDEAVPLMADLLSLPLPERFPPPPSSPDARRQRTLDFLVTWLIGLAEARPVVLVVEDLHWIDPSTLEFLGLLLEQASDARILVVLTHRPGFESPWRRRTNVDHLTLNRLTREQSAALAVGVARGKALPEQLVADVVDKTDGVALYLEEFTKAALESDRVEERGGAYVLTGALHDLDIPSTLQDSLTARLDRLGPGKSVAQLAAVLGREFGFELLEAVHPGDARELEKSLDLLASAGLVYRRGVPPRARYTFKHALIRDAAYRSLLKSIRQQHHERVVRVLEERFAEIAESRPEFVAQHCEAARLVGPAIDYWERAAQRAGERSAHAEAVVHAARGIDLLQSEEHGPESRTRELGLQLIRGGSAIASKGHSDPEVERSYARARELCGRIEDAPRISQALVGLSAFYVTLADLARAHELALQLLDVAEGCQEPPVQVAAHLTVGIPLLFRGEPAAAVEHLERSIALYDPSLDNASAYVSGQDPGVVARAFGAWAHWVAGSPDRALARAEEGIALAREIGEPFNLAFALGFASVLHCLRRENERVQERALELIALCSEQGFPLWLGYGHVTLGWALAASGDERGLGQLERGLGQLATNGVEVARPQVACLFAEALAAAGRPKEALVALENAGPESRQNRFWDAEVLRLEGDVRLGDGGAERPAFELLSRARELARDQGAASFELRAARGLARLLAGQGRGAEGRALLAGIHAGFDEGHATGDLREVEALLGELS